MYGLWLCGLCLTGLVIFYFWPTQVPSLALDATDFPGFAFLRRVDAASNACPSMHVAVAIFTAVRVEVTVKGPESQERYAELATAVDEHCPVLDLFQNPVPVTRSLLTSG